MPVHDAYARPTPYELLFGEPGGSASFRDAVESEAEESGRDPSRWEDFAALRAARELLERVRAEGAGALDDYAALAYHAYSFEAAGRPLYLLGEAAARRLVREAGSGPPEAPERSGYLQLPQHLFWVGDAGDGSPESADGLCWTTDPEGVLHLLVAHGIRPDRPGLGAVSVSAPWEHATDWLRVSARGEGDDFENVLPGAELEALYAFRVAGEVLKLFARFCALVSGGEARVRVREPADPPEGGPRASLLSYRRVEADA